VPGSVPARLGPPLLGRKSAVGRAERGSVTGMRRRARKRRGRLTLARVESGIYLDFEGNAKKPPVLLGVSEARCGSH
jgi:hypothetical protein